jgi:hypothetical protein
LTRLLAEPLLVEVDVRDGLPVTVRLADGPRKVTSICARWRIASDWWRSDVMRDYWKLALSRRPDSGNESGFICELYRDGEGKWYLSRLYD